MAVRLTKGTLASGARAAERSPLPEGDLFTRMFRGSPDGMILLRVRDRIFADVNEAFCRLSGYRRGEIVGRRLEDVSLSPTPSDTAELLNQLGTDGVVTGFPARLRKADGEIVDTSISIQTLDLEGELHVFIASRMASEDGQGLGVGETRFRDVFENSAQAIFQTSLDGQIMAMNRAAAKVLGYDSPEQLMSEVESILEFYVDPEVRGPFLEDLRRTGLVEGVEIQWRRRDGEVVWLSANARIVRDRFGEPIAIEGTPRDITAQRRAEEALRESEERYRLLVESSQDLIVLLDLQGRIVYASPSHERVLGFTPEEIVGGSGPDFVHPDDRSIARAALAAIARGERAHARFRLRRKDGGWVESESVGAAIRDEEGRPAMVLATARDITESLRAERALRDSEARFRALSDATLEGVVFQVEAKVVLSNRAFAEMFGYAEDQLIGMSATAFVPAEIRPAVERRIARVDEEAWETTGLRKDGSMFDMEVVSRNIQLDGRPARVTVIRDITEPKRVERELRDSLMTLRRVMEERDQLTARFALAQEHERAQLANDIHDDPIQKMTAVGLRLETFRRQMSDESQAASLDLLQGIVETAIERLRRMLFDLRPPALDQAGLGAALQEYLDQLSGEAGLTCMLTNRLVHEPDGDRRVIAYRIAQEALHNVRKHAQARHVEVRLEPAEPGFFMLITDDGIGFDPIMVGTAERGHLGLPAMHERAELSGGWLQVTSQPGEGTTIQLWLPS